LLTKIKKWWFIGHLFLTYLDRQKYKLSPKYSKHAQYNTSFTVL
jgi:hypothetical protein